VHGVFGWKFSWQTVQSGVVYSDSIVHHLLTSSTRLVGHLTCTRSIVTVPNGSFSETGLMWTNQIWRKNGLVIIIDILTLLNL